MSREHSGTRRRFRIIGVGDPGWRIADGLRTDSLFESGDDAEVRLIALSTNLLALEATAADRRVHVRRPANGLPVSFRESMKWREGIGEEVTLADVTFAVAGLAVPAEIEMAAVACQIAREKGSLAFAFLVGDPPDDSVAAGAAGVEVISLARTATTFVVPTDDLPLGEAEALARQGIRSLVQIARKRGLLNYSLKDIRETFLGAGLAQIATGRGQGVERIADAARAAFESATLFQPLSSARRVVLHVRMPASASLFDLNALGMLASEACDPDASLLITVYLDSPVEDGVEITLLAAGLPAEQAAG